MYYILIFIGAYLDDFEFLYETGNVICVKDVPHLCVYLGVDATDCDEIISVYSALRNQLFHVGNIKRNQDGRHSFVLWHC